jgi:hypothetical protein
MVHRSCVVGSLRLVRPWGLSRYNASSFIGTLLNAGRGAVRIVVMNFCFAILFGFDPMRPVRVTHFMWVQFLSSTDR